MGAQCHYALLDQTNNEIIFNTLFQITSLWQLALEKRRKQASLSLWPS